MKRFFLLFNVFYICALALLATDYVVISEIMYDTPIDEDPDLPYHNEGEFLELYNIHERAADLSGWTVETISPKQVFCIPEGVILPPKSTLVIAYFDSSIPFNDSTLNEIDAFKNYFCGLYDIEATNELLFLCQDILELPNDTTTLLLKDALGITRDSVEYGIYKTNCYAPNVDMPFYQNGDLKHIYSTQRVQINFNNIGTATFSLRDWKGWNLTNNTNGIINSLWSLTEDFSGCNIIPTGIESQLEGTNYILEVTPLLAMENIDTIQLSCTNAIKQRTYYDPMYRPTLTILLGHTPNHNNLVTLQEYDEYARPTKEWLPITIEVNHLTDKIFKNNVEQYYSSEVRPFVEHSYSTATWDSGIIKNELVGVQKAGADMGGHKMGCVLRGNNSNEIKLFRVTSNGYLEYNGFYDERALYVKETTDEDSNTKVIYTNLQEQVVMEKMDSATTYYVYNDLNQLCYVLPPIAADQLDYGIYSDTIDCLKKYAYVYKYDNRGNQIYKRLPGCEPVLMVYDKGNLLVASQTGNQRNRGDYWIQYTYDKLCRLTRTTEINKSGGVLADTLQAGELIGGLSSTYNLESSNNNIQNAIYSDQALLANHYDNYLFLQFLPSPIKSSLTFEAFEDNTTYSNAKGLLTGTRTYYLDGSGNYSETVYYYDYRGREIQRRSTNHLGGYDVLSTKYDFANNVTDTWSSQSTSNGITTTEHYHYEYDHANRLLTTTYSYNDEPSIELQSYHYDELGRVRSRHIHGGIDSVAFNYDIRNQVTQIKSSGYEQKYYYNQMCPIGDGIVGINYNGNISATTWTFGNKTNGYMYYYDKTNRLKSTYSIIDSEWGDAVYSEGFSYDAHGNITQLNRWDNHDLMNHLTLSYDGNQLSQVDDNGYGSYEYATKQYQDNNTSGNDFAYDANGNMLYDKDRGIAAIRYNLLNLPDTIQFTNGNQIVHRYDAVGNRLATNYYTRKITTTVPLGNTLTGTSNTTNYNITRDAFHNNIVYTANNNDAYGIEFVHNPEGHIRYLTAEEHYHFYYIKDLLGNIRETYVHPEAGYKECIQRMQYYPSGLPWLEAYSPSEQPYKYNGKEFVEMHGLDEYDSKARWYYPAICRTTTMDPLAEKYYSTSPYAWCGNNPIKNVDLDGKEWLDIDGNQIDEHSNIQAYIFYNSKEFGEQSYVMAQKLEKQYGAGTVALSSAITEDEFAQDWINMSGVNIQEVHINHHGSNQAIHLDYINNEYITSTGTGYTQSGKAKAKNVTDLGIPLGDIQNATLYLNTCHSNSSGSWLGNIRFGENRIQGTSATLVGSKETIMQSFFNNFNFKKVRGTAAGVSYNRITREPEPQFFFQRWTIFER